MAMNKKELAEVEALKRQVKLARALSWPNFPKPTPLAKPDDWDKVIHGWTFNVHTQHVNEGWQQGGIHYTERPSKNSVNGSRSSPPMYATKREAWLAMYHELAEKHATDLARVLDEAAKCNDCGTC